MRFKRAIELSGLGGGGGDSKVHIGKLTIQLFGQTSVYTSVQEADRILKVLGQLPGSPKQIPMALFP